MPGNDVSVQERLMSTRRREEFMVKPMSPKAGPRKAKAETEPEPEPIGATMRALAIPAFDLQALVDNYQRNLAAFSASSEVMMRSAQTIMTRQAEIFGEAMLDTMRLVNLSFTAGRNPGAQMELTQELFGKAIRNLQDIATLAQQSGSETMGAINQRVEEVLGKVRQS
jgi:hypothetical protein